MTIRCEHALARQSVVNYGRRIVLTYDTPGRSLHIGGHVPGSVDESVWNIRQFRHPTSNVSPLWIKLGSLQDRVEYPKVWSSIRAHTRGPLPAAVVRGGVAIHEMPHEPLLTPTPIRQQVFDEERGNDHAGAVVHPTGLVQLTHRSIHDRIARASRAPRGELALVVAPLDIAQLGAERLLVHIGKVIQDRDVKLALGQFVQPHLGASPG
jgi:hypothetical protein